ncbi:spermatogenesis associated 6-like protein [Ctenodactylus gundi]
MPLEVVVELQIRAVSCPGVFLPHKQDVYLGVYLLSQYVETDCFPSMFPVVIQQNLRFGKVFENAVDPGAVADLLESFLTRFELIQLVSPVWEELAYYEENTRDFLFPEPKLTPSYPGIDREVLMKTAIDFPGIAPKLEFSTRTAIRECVFLHRNRFLEERSRSQRPLRASHGPIVHLSNIKMKWKESNRPRPPSPHSTRHAFPHQPTQLTLGNNFKPSGKRKPPFVVRHVDSAHPFGENNSENYLWKSRRKSKFSSFPFPMRRASSLDSLAANVKVIKEPDEQIILRNESPSDFSQFGKPMPQIQGDTDFLEKPPFATAQQFSPPSPLDQLLLQERCCPSSQPTRRKIHGRVSSLLTSHRAQSHPKEDSNSEVTYTLERPTYPLKKYPFYKERNL